eukprot:TRINITY_DN11426_c0_g1_i1.p1 TRINITY_DN11426_c0_g1~~TRINITY_DN11426_c0_g1_i1.p1  ORF type:complete len:478 (-),score=116.38 TRINITY_DN11426_c0_g1_i1:128-1369(-)
MGVIEIGAESFVRKEKKNKQAHAFAVVSPKRTFFMYPDNASETDPWMRAITGQIDILKGNGRSSTPATAVASSPTPVASAPVEKTPVSSSAPASSNNNNNNGSGVRDALDKAKYLVPFLLESAQDPTDDNKVYEFWQIWSESMPPQEELVEGAITFEVATSADMEKLTWRTSGPQTIFIQRMVDFFWNVGAPETEIDRLNDVGSLINPVSIGSWIDMSAKGGMDGGWFFPVEVPTKFAAEASDEGDAIDIFSTWAQQHDITHCISVGRDMGAAPPRQTEIRCMVSGSSFEAQLSVALSAYEAFGVPTIPDDVLSMIRENQKPGLALSIITSSEGIVRLGLLFPTPPKSLVSSLCNLSGVPSTTNLFAFESALGGAGPQWVEFQYLMKGFGYGVYKEGFDVIFHYLVGEETPKN